MRVLTVRQPWAWAIIHGGKNIENRVQNIAGTYRGPVAIHAASREATPYNEVAQEIYDRTGNYVLKTFTSAIIGVVDLVDVHPGWIEPQGKPCSPWGIDYVEHAGQHHLVLANPRALTTPIPAKGRLGLWHPDTDLEHAITTALATVREEVNP